MIKKTILMLLVLVGGVMSANARNLYVCIDASTLGYWPNDNAKMMAHFFTGNNTQDKKMTKEIKYGCLWYSCTIDNYSNVLFVRQNPDYGTDTQIDWDNGKWAETSSFSIPSGTDDVVWLLYNDNGYKVSTTEIRTSWSSMTCKNNITVSGDWNSYTTANTTKVDGNTFTFTLTKDQIAGNSDSDIRFRFYNNDYVHFNDAGSAVAGNPQIYPTSSSASLAIASSTSTYYHNKDNTTWYWSITKPAYDYQKIVITAKYIYDNGYKWQISADAYVSPTIKNDYATYAVAAPLDLSKMTGIKKAYYASDATGGKVSLTSLTEAIAANTGLFLAKGTGDISIQVAASGTDLTASNKLKAGDGITSIVSDESTYYYGFQTKPISGPGFYKITSDITVPVGKAYLELSASEAGNAPSFSIELDGETTGLQLINFDSEENIQDNGQMFDLQGRRVAEPTKGIYIVNGKKVVIK
jgi:hypothetical protein